jgi:hypothetical protein
MARMSLNAQYLRNDLEFLSRLTEHFETHATADLWQLSWQVHQRAFGADVLGDPFGNDVSTAWLIPFSLYLEAGEVTRS